MALAFFDMDGTLVDGDTNDIFLKYMLQHQIIDKTFLSPLPRFERLYYEGTLRISDFLEWVMQPLVGMPAEKRDAILNDCLEHEILPGIFPGARKAVAFHAARGDQLIVVSASVDYIVSKVAHSLGINQVLAAVTCRDEHDVLTGSIEGEVPYQDGKRIRIMNYLKSRNLSLEDAYAYGDSVNDLAMFKLCAHRVAVNAAPELKAHPYYAELQPADWRQV